MFRHWGAVISEANIELVRNNFGLTQAVIFDTSTASACSAAVGADCKGREFGASILFLIAPPITKGMVATRVQSNESFIVTTLQLSSQKNK